MSKSLLETCYNLFCCRSWHNHQNICQLDKFPLEEANATANIFQLIVTHAELRSHCWEKLVDPKIMTASKQKIIDMNHESVVHSIHCAPSNARLLLAPAATQNLRGVVPEVPVPSFCA
jgi:hypothetical protein